MYRVGLGYGQGVKWSEEIFHFRTSFPPGGDGGGGVVEASLSSANSLSSSSSSLSSSSSSTSSSSNHYNPAVTFLALADQGYSSSPSHGSQQVSQLISSIINERTIDSIHHIGDLCYADGNDSIWNDWFNMIQPYASRIPYMVANGNHEYDHTLGGGMGKDPSGEDTEFGFQPEWDSTSFHSTGGECGVPISKRFAVPENGNSVFWYVSNIPSNNEGGGGIEKMCCQDQYRPCSIYCIMSRLMYAIFCPLLQRYSYDQSLVHTVVLSSEHNMTVGSRQYDWLEKDLMAVNRTITPWVVVEMHRPLYSKSLRT